MSQRHRPAGAPTPEHRRLSRAVRRLWASGVTIRRVAANFHITEDFVKRLLWEYDEDDEP